MALKSPRTPETPAVDPYQSTIANVQQRYPRLKNVPLSVTTGTGPYESEVYQPWSQDNPNKGKFTIELRSARTKAQRGQDLEDSIAAESLHHLGTTRPDGKPVDPKWYALKQQYRQVMSPGDMRLAQQHWQEEQKSGEKRSFDQFMNESYLDMFFRGYLFPKNQGQEWVNRMQRGGWTPQQKQILEQMRQHLMTAN